MTHGRAGVAELGRWWFASLAQTGELSHAWLRGGSANTGRAAASFVAETISRVRHAGATGRLTLRADSGFYTGAVLSAFRRHHVRYSITARKNRSLQRAIRIDAIPIGAASACRRVLHKQLREPTTTITAPVGITNHEDASRLPHLCIRA